MEKIIVTEEQAKVIERTKDNEWKEDRLVSIYSSTEHLDLVTIARIVEGEEYEVKRGFKERDIVFCYQDNKLYEVIAMLPPDKINEFVTLSYVNSHQSTLKLVCKAENRED